MDWLLVNAATEIDGMIKRLREDQRAQVLISEDAALVELRALDAAHDAHAVIELCRQRLAFDAEEIDRLEGERT